MLKKQRITGIIPARYASVRFPGKPLKILGGKPMVQWVYEGCADSFDHLTVATDDQRIADAVSNFGGNFLMTSASHRTGTERCLEAVQLLKKKGISSDIVVNVQGDEPFIRTEQIEELLGCFDHEDAEIGTLYSILEPGEDPHDPNIVKVIADQAGRAIYFSRSPIPYFRNNAADKKGTYLKHIGLYGYRADTLEKICALPPSSLETAESLEQLRWLENGYHIFIRHTRYQSRGVDTPEDLERLRSQIG